MTNACLKLGVPLEAIRVETPQANGRAEQGVRSLKELLHAQRLDMGRRGCQLALSHPLMKWVVRHCE